VWERLPTKKRVSATAPVRKASSSRGRRASEAAIPLVTNILQGYANKGIFRGFSRGPTGGSRASFHMIWHYDRRLELLLDISKRTLQFPELLPGVDDALYRDFEDFVASRHAEDLPPHRRIDPSKGRLTCRRKGGLVSVTMTVKDSDFEYAARKLIHAVHEIFLAFLADGPYFEYLVEHLGLDPDRF
jgi:hypothetical protein